MLVKKDTLPISTEEAGARRERPQLERFEPDKASHWSITMTLAWVIWRTIDAVRIEWDIYRSECADWVFESNSRARVQAAKILIRRLSAKRTAKTSWALPRRLQKGSWKRHSWGPSGWNGLYLRALFKDMLPQAAIGDLWLAAGEGRIVAIAIECANAKAFDGKLVEIPSHYWAHLTRASDPSGRPILVGLGRVYRDVKFRRLDAKTIWPGAAHPPKPELQSAAVNPASTEFEIEPEPAAHTVRKTRRQSAPAQIESQMMLYYEGLPPGHVPTEREVRKHLKDFGASREPIRELMRKHGRRRPGRPRKPRTTRK